MYVVKCLVPGVQLQGEKENNDICIILLKYLLK